MRFTGFAVSWAIVILYDIIVFGLTVFGARRLREALPSYDQFVMANMEHDPLSIVSLLLRDGALRILYRIWERWRAELPSERARCCLFYVSKHSRLRRACGLESWFYLGSCYWRTLLICSFFWWVRWSHLVWICFAQCIFCFSLDLWARIFSSCSQIKLISWNTHRISIRSTWPL